MPPRWFNMSHNSHRWTPATVWILQKMVWIIEIFGQSPRFSLAETKISPALRFMEIAFWAVFAGISHSAGVQRSDLWVKLNQRGGIFIVSELQNVSKLRRSGIEPNGPPRWGFLRLVVIYDQHAAPTELVHGPSALVRNGP